MDRPSQGLIDPEIFKHLQSKIDEDIKVREELKDILQDLEKQGLTPTPIVTKATHAHG